MSDLTQAIMNLPCRVPASVPTCHEGDYRTGHRDARHAAAELAAAAEAAGADHLERVARALAAADRLLDSMRGYDPAALDRAIADYRAARAATTGEGKA